MKTRLLVIIFLLSYLTGYSQFVDFGKNKVQYSDFDWHTISTPHFKIFYYKEAKELAEIGANYAEESYAILSQKFKHTLIDTVPIIFYSSPIHFKQTNTTPGLIPDGVGGFFEFIKGRVVIPHEGSLGQFKHVIRHELTHVLMVSKLLNQLKLYGKINDRMPPLWFTEGLAEYWSTEWDAQAEMIFKDAVLSDYYPGLSNWEESYGSFLMYKLGQRVLEYIADKYGEEKILELMDNFWMDENFSVVMKHTIGKDYEEFDAEFTPYIKDYYNNLKNNQDTPSKISELVISSEFGHKPTYNGCCSRKEVFYIGNKSGYTSIFKKDLKEKKSSPEMFLFGERSDEFESFHFFRTGMDVSSDGRLAFVSQKGEADALNIFDVKTGDDLGDFSFKNIVGIGSPAWNNDNTKIVFPATDFSGKSDIYIFEIKENNLIRLTNDFYDDRDPDISPDGKYIVFSSDRTSFGENNKYNLFLYEIKTGNIEYLTIGNQLDYSPKFSEDGSKVIFTSDIGGNQNIWMIDFAHHSEIAESENKSGSKPVIYDLEKFVNDYLSPENYKTPLEMRRLTNLTSSAMDPEWAGDNEILFTSFEKRAMKIRKLPGVNNKFDSSDMVVNIDFIKKENIWEPDKLKGISGKNNARYEKDFSMDLATTSITTDPVFGTNAGGVISLSDMLGNERYYFLIFNNSDPNSDFWKSFNVAISKVSLEQRLNYAYGIYHLSGKRYDISESDVSYYERMYGAYLSMAYPLSFFRRLETSTSLSQTTKDIDLLNYRKSLLLSNSVAYIKDNAIYGLTGPVDGEKFNTTLGYTTDIQYSNENFYSVLIDYRKYFQVFPGITFATRGQWFMNEGKNARRFYMGGSWSIRGWSFNSIKGTKMWQTNAEVRFPVFSLWQTKLPLGLNYIIPGMNGAVFFDAGNAFDSFDNYGQTYGSFGAGLRLNLFGFLVLRYDTGKRIENNFSKVQDDLFHQIFFGWDF